MIEINKTFCEANTTIQHSHGTLLITPPLDADYFIARVPLYKGQAIQIFPKFTTVGCGFALEEDWNTNLPLGCDAEQIFDHIKHNKAYQEISDLACLDAIRELQAWAESVQLAGFWRLT